MTSITSSATISLMPSGMGMPIRTGQRWRLSRVGERGSAGEMTSITEFNPSDFNAAV
jgi:hypothetical protein